MPCLPKLNPSFLLFVSLWSFNMPAGLLGALYSTSNFQWSTNKIFPSIITYIINLSSTNHHHLTTILTHSVVMGTSDHYLIFCRILTLIRAHINSHLPSNAIILFQCSPHFHFILECTTHTLGDTLLVWKSDALFGLTHFKSVSLKSSDKSFLSVISQRSMKWTWSYHLQVCSQQVTICTFLKWLIISRFAFSVITNFFRIVEEGVSSLDIDWDSASTSETDWEHPKSAKFGFTHKYWIKFGPNYIICSMICCSQFPPCTNYSINLVCKNKFSIELQHCIFYYQFHESGWFVTLFTSNKFWRLSL